MIPNITLDNAVEQYIKLLASAGSVEWKIGGKAYAEWIGRKESVAFLDLFITF